MSKIDDGGPAFPILYQMGHDRGPSVGHDGMTLRDYFAARVMSAVWMERPPNSAEHIPEAMECAAAICYCIADAMIAERQKVRPT